MDYIQSFISIKIDIPDEDHILRRFALSMNIVIHLLAREALIYEPAPTSAPWTKNGKWSENRFPLGSRSLTNHGG